MAVSQVQETVFTINETYPAQGQETVFTINETYPPQGSKENRPAYRSAYETRENFVAKKVDDENLQCTVMLWEQYLARPAVLHSSFALPDTDKYILDLSGGRNGKRDIELNVNTPDDISKLNDDLLRRMILLKGKVTYEKIQTIGEHKGVSRHHREMWKDELAVLINTSHPKVHRYIQNLLWKGIEALQQNKNVCLELSFGSDVRTWYGWKVDGYRSNDYFPTDRIAESKHLTIFIHNCSVPVRFFMHKWVIACCFPCWLMSCGLCYFIFRKARVTDIKETFHTKVTARHTGMYVGESTPCCGCATIYHMKDWECSDWDGIERI